MKLLTIDIGNTEMKWGVFDDGHLVSVKRMPTHVPVPASLHELVALELAIPGKLDGLAYASVVPFAESALLKALGEAVNIKGPVVSTTEPGLQAALALAGIQFDDYPQDQLGADRLVNVVAAAREYPGQNVIVADFGTATTLNVLTADGRFQGGIITPGLKTFADVLNVKTAKLPPVSDMAVPPAVGKNTADCLQSGIVHGYIGLLVELFAQIEAQYPNARFKKIATGGLANTVIALAGSRVAFDKVDSAWTLVGLRHLFEAAERIS